MKSGKDFSRFYHRVTTTGDPNQRRPQMRTIGYFAAAAVLILIGLGMWTIPTTHAFVTFARLDPFGMMTSVKVLPTAQYDDYSVVFN
jgi:hypothetical protein